LNSIQAVSFFVIPMGILLMLSAFFSGAETALFSLSSEERRHLASHRQVASLLALLRRNPSGLLTSILFGNLVVNVLFFSTGAAAAARWGAERGEWVEAVAGLAILILVILLGEIIPKAIGVTHPSGVLFFAAVPLRFWFSWTAPFRTGVHWLLEWLHLNENEPSREMNITSGELCELLDAVRHEPGFGLHEREVIEDIINLSDVRAREIMTPRISVFRCSLDVDVDKLLDEARRHEHRRVLVCRDGEDELLGYVRLRDLFFAPNPPETIQPFLRLLNFVPETCRADCLLHDFMENRWELVGVVDEYGGLAGIVTREDILSEVAGDMEEEIDGQVVQLDNATYRLSGQLPIRSWRELFAGRLIEPDVEHLAFDTLGGLIISILGRMPCVGDSVSVCNLQLKVESISHRRIASVLLHLQTSEVDE
jgi:putative hemolysin